MKKKLKKALMAGAALYGASKLAGSDSDKFLSSGAAGGARLPKGDSMARARRLMTSDAAMKGGKGYKDAIMTGGKGTQLGKIGLLQRAKNFMADEVFTTDPKTSIDIGFSGGAKYGKMIKANQGTYVKASCKMGRNKPTKIT